MRVWLTLLGIAVIILTAWVWQAMRAPVQVQTLLSEQLSSNESRIAKLQKKSPIQNEIARVEGVQNKDQVDEILDLLSEGNIDLALEHFQRDLSELAQLPDLGAEVVSALMRNERYQEAIDLMYEQRLFVSFEQEVALLEQIHREVMRVEEVLVGNGDIAGVIAFYEQLIYLEADYMPYYLSLAKWQLKAGNQLGAQQSLESVRHDIRYAEQVEKLEATLAGDLVEDSNVKVIPLIKKGRHFAVDVNVDGLTMARLMIDTGATMTVIKSSLLQSIDLSVDDSQEALELMTANGPASGYRLVLNELGLGSELLRNVDVVSMPLKSFEFDGLLGMNVLSQYEFKIDQAESVLYLY